MACLHNPQWEKFARELVELQLTCDLKARAKAYERAGYVPNPHNARKLANRPAVKARVQQLFAEAIEYQDVRVAAVINRIDRVGRANLSDFLEDDGRTLKNLKTLPREITDALEAIDWVEDGADKDGNPIYRPKIKLRDANQANFVLLKHFGGMPEPPAASVNVSLFNALSIDDQRALAEALEALPAGPAVPDRAAQRERSPG